MHDTAMSADCQVRLRYETKAAHAMKGMKGERGSLTMTASRMTALLRSALSVCERDAIRNGLCSPTYTTEEGS